MANGRTYAQLNGHLYPVSGPGLTALSKGAFSALKTLNQLKGSEQAYKILSGIKDISAQDIKAAKEVYQKINKK